MDWSLFYISAALWYFFGEHFAWSARLMAMRDAGLPLPDAIIKASRLLCGLTMLNLTIFLFVYGFMSSWLWSVIIVVGGYIAAMLLIFLTRSFQGTAMHKLGWLAMPALSIGIWWVAFAA